MSEKNEIPTACEIIQTTMEKLPGVDPDFEIGITEGKVNHAVITLPAEYVPVKKVSYSPGKWSVCGKEFGSLDEVLSHCRTYRIRQIKSSRSRQARELERLQGVEG